MEELLDILNEKGEKTGESVTHAGAHNLGSLHRTVHVWIVNSKNQLLLQKRSKNKRAHPNLWDISASGHISSGESSLEGAQRETREELGLSFSLEDFEYLFTVEEHVVLNEGTYVNNEFNDIYLVRQDVSLSEIKFLDNEVEDIKWISIEDFKKWTRGEGEELVPHKEEYAKLLEYLDKM